jgi:hypothetical protein
LVVGFVVLFAVVPLLCTPVLNEPLLFVLEAVPVPAKLFPYALLLPEVVPVVRLLFVPYVAVVPVVAAVPP